MTTTPRLRARLLLLGFLATAPLPGAAQDPTPSAAPRYDLVLRGGSLLDGSKAPARRGDLGIADGRIAAIGDVPFAPGTPVLDVTGLHIAPGFVDVHVHVDAEVARGPLCANFLRMGVTTLITGNCGRSVADLAAHFRRLEAGGIGVNYGSLVGHGTVRTAVMGTANRAPTADELRGMQELVAAGMAAGAFGMSTGLIYVPGTYAHEDELTALATVAAKHGGIYASHMRNEGDAVLDAIAEALRIGDRSGCAVHISHLKCTGAGNHGRAAEVLRLLREAQARGVRVSADQYAYDASSTGLDVLFPAAELDARRDGLAQRLRSDAGFRRKIHRALLAKMDAVGFGDFRYARIASAKGNEDLNGLLLPEAAQRRLQRSDRDAQAELAIELLIAAAPDRVTMVYHTMAEADVQRFLAEDWIAIASDAGLRQDGGADRPHPRGAGNNPRVLGRYVRERGALELAVAVHKMTALPAKLFGIADRGELRPGAFADLVVFAADQVADTATYDDPFGAPRGLPMVFVNGQLALSQGQPTGVKAGQVLRHTSPQTR